MGFRTERIHTNRATEKPILSKMMRIKSKIFFPFLCVLQSWNALHAAADVDKQKVSRSRCATHTSTTQDKAYTPWIRVEGTVLYWVPEAAGLETYFGKGASQYYTSGGI